MFRNLTSFLLIFACPLLIAQSAIKLELKKLNSREKLDYILELSPEDKLSNLDAIMLALDDVRSAAERQNNFHELTKLEIAQGSVDFALKKYSKLIPSLNTLLTNSELLTTEDSAQVLYILKNSYVRIKNAAKAFEVHKMLVNMNNRGVVPDHKLLDPPLSVIYMEMGLYESAVTQLKIEFAQKKIDSASAIELAQFYNNAGVYFKRGKNYDSAFVNFQRASELIKKELQSGNKDSSISFFSALIEGNIGSVLSCQNKFQQALPLMKKDISWSLMTRNYESAANAYTDVAACYVKLNKPEEARNAIDSAFVLYAKVRNPGAELNAHRVNAEVFKSARNFRMAAVEYAYYTRKKDSLIELEKQTQLVNDQVAFELGEKENQLKEQKLKIEESQRALDNNRSNTIALLIAIVAIAIISFILFIGYRNSTKRQKELEVKNEEISGKNTVIEQSLHEKEALIKEVHHRVKNNLQIISSLLRLQSAKQSDEYVQTMFDESVKRIQSMALVHELLYKNKNLVSIPIHKYIESLVEGLSASYGYSNVKIAVRCDEVQLDIDTTIPLGLIINELVTNSMKHAFDGKDGNIAVDFSMRNGKRYLIVQDDGKGLPENFTSLKENSLGMELVEALAEQINARYSYSSEKGSKFEFEF